MFKLNGKVLQLDTAFTHDGIQYPANWLRLASQEDRESIGIEDIEYEARPDDRFYFITDNGDGTYTKIPKDLNDLKKSLKLQVKMTANSMLSMSDWRVVRSQETGAALDEDTASFRASIRSKSNEIEASIDACVSVLELMEVNLSDWPIVETP